MFDVITCACLTRAVIKTYDLTLADGRIVTLRIPSFGNMGSLVECEVRQ